MNNKRNYVIKKSIVLARLSPYWLHGPFRNLEKAAEQRAADQQRPDSFRPLCKVLSAPAQAAKNRKVGGGELFGDCTQLWRNLL